MSIHYQDLDDFGSDEGKKKSRRRTKTNRFEFDDLDNEEQKVIQQALKNSLRETKRVELDIPDAPIYSPTVEEWKDPLEYLKKIRLEAEPFGIIKIVPPPEWKPKCTIDHNCPKVFTTKLQQIDTLQEGQGFDEGKFYNISSYQEMGDKFKKEWIDTYYDGITPTEDELAKDYWSIVETGTRRALVEYANDIDTVKFQSGFPYEPSKRGTGVESKDCPDMFSDDYYARCGWNLNNIPQAQGSVLKHLQTPINGVNVPWLYLGMLFSSFCWHNEDNYLYSINYSHFGDTKQWYGVAGSDARSFEKVSKSFLMDAFKASPDLLHHMTTQISPSLLMRSGVPVYKAKQTAGTYIVTFPKAFHCGFSYGYNCGEAVNFATNDWLIAGGESAERYRLFARNSVFSQHRLIFTLLKHHYDEVALTPFGVDLAIESLRVLDEEIASRPIILGTGIRELASRVKMPVNDFNTIDRKSADYDDLRTCSICQHNCIFSAVACECDNKRLSCVRHFHVICKCSKDKKFLLTWGDTIELKKAQTVLRERLDNRNILNENKKVKLNETSPSKIDISNEVSGLLSSPSSSL